MAADTFQEFEGGGISFMVLPYGEGALQRCTATNFKNEITGGIAFTGRLATDVLLLFILPSSS